MPIEFFQTVIGIIGVGCAFMLARTIVGVRKGRLKGTRITGWVIRTLLCLTAVAIRHPVDAIDLAFWTASAAAFAGGWVVTSRERPPEDLTHEIFPDEP
jgi:hypothetical protein